MGQLHPLSMLIGVNPNSPGEPRASRFKFHGIADERRWLGGNRRSIGFEQRIGSRLSV
jgi:hypothetical protein